ncbi:MAG: zinc-binding dehydrogenase [Leucobacter sp.]
MLALEFEAPRELRLAELERPEAAAGELVLEVVATGICGTDLKIARGEHRLYPAGTVRVPGHELVGRIRENRSERADLRVGDLVAVAPNIACGHCRSCRRNRPNLCEHYESIGLTMNGGLAESVRLPVRAVEQGNAIPTPEGMDPLDAVLMEPLAAVLRGLTALDFGEGDSLAVIGAGPIGLLAVQLARQWGASRVIVSQTSAARRELARRFGADATVDPRAENLTEAVRRLTDGAGADCVLVATPVPAVFGEALQLAAVGGRINFFAGLPSGAGEVALDANLIHYRELGVTGSTANTTADCVAALDILSERAESYRPLITHTFPLVRAAEAFETAADGAALKVVVTP